MSGKIVSILSDYSILLYSRFVNFILNSELKDNFYISNRNKNQTFIVQKHSVGEYLSAIKSFSPSRGLSFDEKKLILLLIGANFFGEDGINIWHACSFFHRLPVRAIQALVKILNVKSSILRSGILMVQEKDFFGTSISIEDIAQFYNERKVYLSPFFISSFFNTFSGEGRTATYILSSKYRDVDTFINDVSNFMKYLFFLSSYSKVNFSSYVYKKGNSYEKGELAKYIRDLKKNILNSKLKFGLKTFLKDNKLSNIEFVVLLYLIYKVILKKESVINNVDEVLEKLAFYPSQIESVLKCFDKDSIFYKEGFLITYESQMYYEDEEESFDFQEEEDFISSDFYPINISKEKIYELIFSRTQRKMVDVKTEKYEKVSGLRENLESGRVKGLYEIIVPKVKLENVILDDNVKSELMGAVDLTKAAEIMKEWGVKPNLASNSYGSVKILLYGASGTGKTITAQALAGEANAELFKVDASNLVSSWVGESSKNVKRVFREFYNYVKQSNKRVFLFINEADQLLSARGAVLQAADKEYNQMQNILLEELENFEGVFIATTNLPDILDSAWNRRFNVKIKFEIPKYETRIKLWKAHISEKMPLAKDVNIEKLAEYELSGGSIANVIYNAARRAALRDEKNRIITQQDFLEGIQQELKSHIGGKTVKVGF
jgi:ATP-dependent 26S proteasome regulatory subunit